MKNVKRIISGTLITIIVMYIISQSVAAQSASYEEQGIQFRSKDNILLQGTVLIPAGEGPHPAIILIHGAGAHDREEYRAEAEIFAKSGIAVLIYDKRTVGYSVDGIGEQSRSYSLLADDALAAVDALRSRKDINQNNIGLWGLSEGGSVAPLAAKQSSEVAFVITVSASGVPPAQQTSWAMENEFRQQGITADSFIHSITRTGIGFLVSAGLFAEATYNHVPPLEQLHHPLLAIWGSNDRTAPPAESYQIMREALERGGNRHYTLQFVPNANHDLRSSPDGFISSEQLAPGYAEAMTSWIEDVLKGEKSHRSIVGDIPQQDFTSFSEVVQPSWYDTAWLHLGIIVLLVTFFSSYYGIALLRLFRKCKEIHIKTRLRWNARILAISGIASILGFFGYFGYIMITHHPGLVIFGVPLPWLFLQLLSIFTCVLTLMLTVSWGYIRSVIACSERVRLSLLLVGGMLFILWALYWNLLSP